MEQIKKTLDGFKTKVDELTVSNAILVNEVKDRDAKLSERDNEINEMRRKQILGQTALDRAEKLAKDSATERNAMDEINSRNETLTRRTQFLEDQVAKLQATLALKTEEVRKSEMHYEDLKREFSKFELEHSKLKANYETLEATNKKTVDEYLKLQADLNELN